MTGTPTVSGEVETCRTYLSRERGCSDKRQTGVVTTVTSGPVGDTEEAVREVTWLVVYDRKVGRRTESRDVQPLTKRHVPVVLHPSSPT